MEDYFGTRSSVTANGRVGELRDLGKRKENSRVNEF